MPRSNKRYKRGEKIRIDWNEPDLSGVDWRGMVWSVGGKREEKIGKDGTESEKKRINENAD